ncbi:MAG: asparagine synthase [Acidobacteria bacterium]|nr:asparagine synthase [Acidobacteriota bacterium]
MGFLLGGLGAGGGFAAAGELLAEPREGRQDLAAGEWRLAAGGEHARGFCGVLERRPGGAVAIYGDRLGPDGALSVALDADQLIAWCSRGFARFAGALCTADRLVLWTDEDATCPLFYSFDAAGDPVFASEAKALLLLRGGGLAAFADELAGGDGERPLPPIGGSSFARIAAVPPASRVSFRRTGAGWRIDGVERYLPPVPEPTVIDADTATDAVAAGLEEAVARLVAGLDEVHVTLSGGVDSSAVAALARPRVDRMLSYTVGTRFGDEFEQAEEVARWLGTEHRTLMMTSQDLEDLLPDLLWQLETWDPLTLQIAAPVAFLYRRLAVSGVFLTGYGADLIFAGAVDTRLGETELERLIRHQVELTVPTNEMAPAFARRAGAVVRYPYWLPEVKRTGLGIRARLKVADGEVKVVLRKAVERFLPRHVAWRTKQGIHQGSSMGEMFREVLGTGDGAEQARWLRRLFAETVTERLSRSGAADDVVVEAHYSEDAR